MVLLPIVRVVQIAATVLIGGAAAFELLFLARGGIAAGVAQQARGWVRTIALGALAFGIVSWFAWLGMLAINMSGLAPAEALHLSVLETVVGRTTFGHAWCVRLVLFVLLAASFVTMRSARALQVARALLAAALAASLAWTGHALGSDAMHLAADAVHLLAATLWIGMLPPLWLVVRRSGASSAWAAFATLAVTRFFVPGAVAVALLIATGVANALWLVGSFAGLVGTTYGVLLLLKVSLFACMLVFAAANRFQLTAQLAAQAGQPRDADTLRLLRRNVLAEAVLGAGVLLVVAFLGITPPAAAERGMQPMNDMGEMSGM